MKIKCCGQSKKQKGKDIHTASEIVAQKKFVERYALQPLGTTIRNLENMPDKKLGILSTFLREYTLAVTTELAKRGGHRYT